MARIQSLNFLKLPCEVVVKIQRVSIITTSLALPLVLEIRQIQFSVSIVGTL